jgi:hypothetical protein
MTSKTQGHRETDSGAQEWGRGKLLAALGLILVLILGAATGAGLWVWQRLHPAEQPNAALAHPGSSPGGAGVSAAGGSQADPVTARRDAIAAAPMPAADPAAAQPSVLSTRDPGMIALPASTTAGPAGIASGFPHTTEGALAQLAAIDADVMSTATLERARQVIAEWAVPGGPTGETWTAVKVLAAFHSAAGLAGGAGDGLVVHATPMMGLVKGSDGPDWVVVCVNLQIDATLRRTARVAAADCQRMVWDGGRWLIGPGSEPWPAASTWPGTDAAIDAGWKNLRHA